MLSRSRSRPKSQDIDTRLGQLHFKQSDAELVV